jgi:hypothetical protein
MIDFLLFFAGVGNGIWFVKSKSMTMRTLSVVCLVVIGLTLKFLGL